MTEQREDVAGGEVSVAPATGTDTSRRNAVDAAASASGASASVGGRGYAGRVTVWTEITGQRDAVAELSRAAAIDPGGAAADAAAAEGGLFDAFASDDADGSSAGASPEPSGRTMSAMTHAWLITGPPDRAGRTSPTRSRQPS